MRYAGIVLVLACAVTPLWAQENVESPTSEKAQKAYKGALEYLHRGMKGAALDGFKKADKEDGRRCAACQQQMIKYGIELQEWKAAESAAQEMIAESQNQRDAAIAHYEFGMVLMYEGLAKRKDEIITLEHDEMTKALAAAPNFPAAIFADGQALARLKQDDAARSQFQRFVKLAQPDDPNRQRALRYISRPDLARARMAPPFAVTTLDGQRISLDDLKGKVVLIDFWATWCGPCREALPHMRKIASKFDGQPLVVLSVSLDSDEEKWKEFVAKNGMTWMNCRDGGFEGPIAKLFGVQAIPHTFTIDADGVLQDEQIGDASIKGKLKKLISHAQELQVADKPTQ
jgi:thiol-disulfide isomerase/thioredoxin